MTPNPSIERTSQKPLRALCAAAHVERLEGYKSTHHLKGKIAMRTTLLSLLIVFVSACSTTTATSPEASMHQVAAATDEWRAAYDSREPRRITAQYAADAALWGTNLKVIATNSSAVAEYFKDAPARPDARVVFGEQNIRVYGDFALNSGTYTFKGVRDGKPSSTPARYSFAFRRQEGKWLIVDHHSSRLPQ